MDFEKDINSFVEKNDKSGLLQYIKDNNLEYVDGVIRHKDVNYAKAQSGFWKQRQQARKILLNSLYGAILNEGFRMFDQRMGQSVTLTGRSITKHMISTVNKEITGSYDVEGESIVYSDTDSCYFSAQKEFEKNGMADMLEDADFMIDLYDNVAEKANESFPDFMNKAFNTGLERGNIIKAGRECVGSISYFVKKKKYAITIIDDEGTRLDKDGSWGKLKITGLDIKRADTPKFVQEFLQGLLVDLLKGKTKNEIFSQIKDFRKYFRGLKPWQQGGTRKVNNMSSYMDKLKSASGSGLAPSAKVNLPGNVQAAYAWNIMRDIMKDNSVPEIKDGSRMIVCTLKRNQYGFSTMAYPLELDNKLPKWYMDLPFNSEEMENILIDKKLHNMFGCLNWDLENTKVDTAIDDFFDW